MGLAWGFFVIVLLIAVPVFIFLAGLTVLLMKAGFKGDGKGSYVCVIVGVLTLAATALSGWFCWFILSNIIDLMSHTY